MIRRILWAVSVALLCFPAFAGPRVLTDIAPVQGLVAMVMGDTGQPASAVPAGGSPHHHAMRPSDARRIAGADLVFVVGAGLTPWLDRALEQLAPGAEVIALIAQPGTRHLPLGPARGEADAGHAHGDGHGHDHGHGHGHGHQDGTSSREQTSAAPLQKVPDPHAWLDPQNASLWLGVIADALSRIDPGNANTYAANRKQAEQAISQMDQSIAGRLHDVRNRPFLEQHAALGYFSSYYDLGPAVAVLSSHAVRPGARYLAELDQRIATDQPTCLFVDTDAPAALSMRLAEEHGLTLARIDPAGSLTAPGTDQYVRMMSALARDISGCLGG